MSRLRCSPPASHIPAAYTLACRTSAALRRHASQRPRPRTRAERHADAVWRNMAHTALFSAPPSTPRLVTGV